MFFYVEKVRSTPLSDETMVDELSSGRADWKVFCRDGFSLNGRRNGSNRGIESRPNLGGCFGRLY